MTDAEVSHGGAVVSRADRADRKSSDFLVLRPADDLFVNLNVPPGDQRRMVALPHLPRRLSWLWMTGTKPLEYSFLQTRQIARLEKFRSLSPGGDVHQPSNPGAKKLQVPRQTFRRHQSKRFLERGVDKT